MRCAFKKFTSFFIFPDEGPINVILNEKITREKVKEIFGSSTSLKIMLVGEPGIGKSTLINGILGKEVAKVSEPGEVTEKGVTRKLTEYVAEEGSVSITLWDTPGLLDESGDPEKVLADIKKICTSSSIDLVYFCINMTSARCIKGGKVKTAIDRFTETVGRDIWGNTIIILTKANSVISELLDVTDNDYKKTEKGYQRKLSDWKSIINKTLDLDTDQIPVIPAGIASKPKILKTDKEYWLSVLWEETYKRMKREGARVSLVKLNIRRLQEEINEDEARKQQLHKQPIQVSFLKPFVKGGAVGGTLTGIGVTILSVCGIASALNPVGIGAIGVGAVAGGLYNVYRNC